MKSTTLLLVGLFLSFVNYAQNKIHHMDVFVQNSLEETTVDNATVFTSYKEPIMFIALNDTSNISSFVVSLGTTNGGSDIFQRTFIYDAQGSFEDGTSYSRDGVYVRLSLGKLTNLPAYYAQVRAIVNGYLQSAVNYIAE